MPADPRSPRSAGIVVLATLAVAGGRVTGAAPPGGANLPRGWPLGTWELLSA